MSAESTSSIAPSCRICKQAHDNGLEVDLCPDHVKLRNLKCCTATFHAQCLITQFLDTFATSFFATSTPSTDTDAAQPISRVPKFTCPACKQRVYIEDYVVDDEKMSKRELQLVKACVAANMHVVVTLREELLRKTFLLESSEKQKQELLNHIKCTEVHQTMGGIPGLSDIPPDQICVEVLQRPKKRQRSSQS